jgi:hypothetical protein
MINQENKNNYSNLQYLIANIIIRYIKIFVHINYK